KKIPLVDAAMHARHCWGLLAEDLDDVPAESLVTALKQAGVEALRLPSSRIVSPAVPKMVRRVEQTGQELLGIGSSTQELPERFALNDVDVVAAAYFEETTTAQRKTTEGPTAGQKALSAGIMLATGIPVNIGGKKREVIKKVMHSELIG